MTSNPADPEDREKWKSFETTLDPSNCASPQLIIWFYKETSFCGIKLWIGPQQFTFDIFTFILLPPPFGYNVLTTEG